MTRRSQGSLAHTASLCLDGTAAAAAAVVVIVVVVVVVAGGRRGDNDCSVFSAVPLEASARSFTPSSVCLFALQSFYFHASCGRVCYCRQGQARPCAPSLKGQFAPVMDGWGFCSVHRPLWTCGVVGFSGKIPAWRRHGGSDTRLHAAGAAPSSKFSGGRFGPNLPGNNREFSGPEYSPQPAGHEAAFKSGRLCTQTPAGSRQAASLPKEKKARCLHGHAAAAGL